MSNLDLRIKVKNNKANHSSQNKQQQSQYTNNHYQNNINISNNTMKFQSGESQTKVQSQ